MLPHTAATLPPTVAVTLLTVAAGMRPTAAVTLPLTAVVTLRMVAADVEGNGYSGERFTRSPSGLKRD